MIPEHAKKVFSWILFDTYQWEQELYDGTTTVFEKVKRIDGSCVVAEADGKICISRESQPSRWDFVCLLGGMIERGEDVDEWVRRELLEESGLVSDEWKFLCYHRPGIKVECERKMYLARNCRKVAQPVLDAGERIRLESVEFEEFIELMISWVLDEPFLCKWLLEQHYQDGSWDRIKKMFVG